jgi:allantoicase
MIEKLRKRLDKIEKELDKCRTSSFIDGWQTQRHAKKSRKWDVLAQDKMKLIQQIEDYENIPKE